MGYRDQGGSKCGNRMIVGVDANVQVVQDNVRPRLHYTGLHRSVAIFIPDSAAVYTTPQ